MKLEQVVLENFGIYGHKAFDFNQASLIVIYGTNESGKTTALNGLRQAIFGFRPRTPYLTGQQMSACVTGELFDGRQIDFTRRKGRPDDVQGMLDGKLIAEDELRRLLCDIDLESYEHLFGFSQDELRRGQDTLKSIRLSEALAGGSLSGINALERLRSELEESLGELYKPRGSTSKINVKLTELRQIQEALRGSDVLPTEVEQYRSSLREMNRQSEDLKADYVRLLGKKNASEKKQQALPKYRELEAVQTRLDAIEIPDELDATFLNQWGDYADQRKTLMQLIEEERRALDADQALLKSLGGNSLFLEHELAIEQLGHLASEIPMIRQRLDSQQNVKRVALESRDRLLEYLQLESVESSVMNFSVSVPRRQSLEVAANEFMRLESELVELRVRESSVNEKLTELQSSTASDTPPPNFEELESRVQQLGAALDSSQLQARRLEEALADESFQNLTSRVQELLPPDVEVDATWEAPTESQISDFDRRSSEIELQNKQVQLELETKKGELEEVLQQPSDSVADDALQILAKSAQFGQQRNAIINEWLDELSQPLIAASISVEQQLERLSELKRIGDGSDKTLEELLQSTETLAAEHRRRETVDQLNEKIQQLESNLAELRTEKSELVGRWQSAWDSLPFEPRSPKEMVVWLRDFMQWSIHRTKLSEQRRELHIRRGLEKTARGRVLDLWPTNLPEDVSLDLLQRQLQQWSQQALTLRRSKEQTLHAKSQLVKLTKQIAECEREQQTHQRAFSTWLATCPVTQEWPIGKVCELIDSLDRLRREQQTLDEADQQLADLGARLVRFDQAVSELMQLLGSADQPNRDSSSGDSVNGDSVDKDQRAERKRGDTNGTVASEVRASAWLKSLHELRLERTQRVKLTAQIDHRTKRLQEATKRLEKIDSKLAAFCTANAHSSVADVAGLVERAREADKLRVQASELRAALVSYCGAEGLDAFLEALSEADETSLQVQISECAAELSRLDQQRRETDQQIGSLTERIESIANSQESLRNMQLLQNHRGELTELSEQWVVQRIARELLSRTIERFANDNEPALLKLTRTYLQQLTAGRYVDVEHDKAGKGQFVVRNSSGQAITPDKLSTGTREQLYLAIRMAFVTHHASDNEPLPVLMDDCFVNFDDQRTQLALESIFAWDHRLQSIILSCHSRVVKILAKIAPQTPVILLDADTTMPAGNVVRELSLDPSREL